MTAPPDFSPSRDWALANPELALLVVAAVAAFFALALMTKPHAGRTIVEALFRSYLFFAVALLFLAKATAAGIFGANAAAAIHAAPVPFVPAVAYADLAFALLGLLALGRSLGFRGAAVAAPAVYLLAPLVATPPSSAALAAHAPEVAVVLTGAFLLLLQLSVERPAPPLPHAGSAAP